MEGRRLAACATPVSRSWRSPPGCATTARPVVPASAAAGVIDKIFGKPNLTGIGSYYGHGGCIRDQDQFFDLFLSLFIVLNSPDISQRKGI